MPRRKKKSRRSGFRIGGIGAKGIVAGIIGMTIIPRIVPVQSSGAVKLATGLGLKTLRIGGGAPLMAVGAMELAAQYVAPMLGGLGAGGTGGTDF